MKLHTDKESFKELIELSANHFGYEQSHIEKDYWVCKILQEISMSELSSKVFFKGGTSLSKAYGVIKRFSEDLDLFVFTGDTNASKQAEKNLNKNLSKFIISCNQDIYREELSETGGNFRKLYFSYDNVYKGVGLKENLEVEIKSCDLADKSQMFYPSERRRIKSIIAEYLEVISKEELIEMFDLHGFEIKCLDPRKTICDKISRLTKLSYDDNNFELIAKHIRDIYDLCLLNGRYDDFMRSEDFYKAMYLVTLEDGLNHNSQSHRSLSEGVLFQNPASTIKIPQILSAYNIELRKLMFDPNNMPTIDEVITSLSNIGDSLKKFDEYRRMLNREK